MTDVVTAAVIRLEAEGWPEPVYAHRLWDAPDPGSGVVVVTIGSDWAAMRTTVQAPVLRVQVYAAPSPDQDDAETIALELADRVRAVLHRPQGGATHWADDLRILSSLHVGSGLAEVEGHESWRVRSLAFEVQTG